MTQYYVHSAFTIFPDWWIPLLFSLLTCARKASTNHFHFVDGTLRVCDFFFHQLLPGTLWCDHWAWKTTLTEIYKSCCLGKRCWNIYILMSHSGSGSNRRSVIHQTTRRKRQNTIRCAESCYLNKNGFNFPGELIWCGVVMRLTERNQGKENPRLYHSSCHSN